MGDLMVQSADMGRSVATIEQRELSVEETVRQANKIHDLMKRGMEPGLHYGNIPGVDKPSLLKPGAEKIDFMFQLSPKYNIKQTDLPNGHREYQIITDLYHRDGTWVGQGVGSCSTMESKYRWRNASRKCPQCGKEAIIKGKEEYGGGWICFAKKGGCGAKFSEDDGAITSQEVGKVENTDIADCYNTVLKIAKKRSHVDATICTTAASDIFCADMEEGEAAEDGNRQGGAPTPAPPKPKAKRPATLRDQIGRLVMDASGHPINGFSKDEIEKARKFCDEHQGDDIAMAAELKRLTELSAGARAALNAEASVGFGA